MLKESQPITSQLSRARRVLVPALLSAATVTGGIYATTHDGEHQIGHAPVEAEALPVLPQVKIGTLELVDDVEEVTELSNGTIQQQEMVELEDHGAQDVTDEGEDQYQELTTTTTTSTTVVPQNVEEVEASPPITSDPPVATEPIVEVEVPPTLPPNEKLRLPEPIPMSPEIARALKENTVFIDGLGCSGYLLRNAEGMPIGAVTAEHCGLENNDRERKVDENGNQYIESYGDITLKVGDSPLEWVDAGKVGSIIVPSIDAYGTDFALLVLEGQSDKDVIAAYHQAPRLSQGETAYLSAWPSDQDTNPNAYSRQAWELLYLGDVSLTTTKGKYLSETAAFALKSNENGAECSFGASGSVAISKDLMHVGTLAAFDEFVPDAWHTDVMSAEKAREYYASLFNVNLDDYTNICLFSTATALDLSKFDVIDVHNITQEFDADPAIQQIKAEAMTEFQDVSRPKTYIEGWLKWLPNKGGPGIAPYIQNPLVYINSAGDTLFYWRDDSRAEGFNYIFLSASTADEGLQIFVTDEGDFLKQTTGVVGNNLTDNTLVSYIDETGKMVGGTSMDIPPNAKEKIIAITNGKITSTVTSAPK